MDPLFRKNDQVGDPKTGAVYEVVDVLGGGSFSQVCHVRRRDKDEPDRALECTQLEEGQSSEALAREARHLIALAPHRNIARCFAEWTVEREGRPRVHVTVNELCARGTLRDLIKHLLSTGVNALRLPSRRDKATSNLALLVKDLLCAMAYLEDMGIVHGDIRPENIAVDASLTFKMCHFGMFPTSASGFGADDTQTTVLAAARGTVSYMAPEVFSACLAGQRVALSAKTDAWSAGLTLLEALRLSATPLAGTSITDVLAFHEKAKQTSVVAINKLADGIDGACKDTSCAQTNRRVQSVLTRLTDYSREARFSAKAAHGMLNQLLEGVKSEQLAGVLWAATAQTSAEGAATTHNGNAGVHETVRATPSPGAASAREDGSAASRVEKAEGVPPAKPRRLSKTTENDACPAGHSPAAAPVAFSTSAAQKPPIAVRPAGHPPALAHDAPTTSAAAKPPIAARPAGQGLAAPPDATFTLTAAKPPIARRPPGLRLRSVSDAPTPTSTSHGVLAAGTRSRTRSNEARTPGATASAVTGAAAPKVAFGRGEGHGPVVVVEAAGHVARERRLSAGAERPRRPSAECVVPAASVDGGVEFRVDKVPPTLISAPLDAVHVSHVGFNQFTGEFEVVGRDALPRGMAEVIARSEPPRAAVLKGVAREVKERLKGAHKSLLGKEEEGNDGEGDDGHERIGGDETGAREGSGDARGRNRSFDGHP